MIGPSVSAQLSPHTAERIVMNADRPQSEDEDTQPELPKDIGERPTLRWIRIAEKIDEAAAVTLRWGSGSRMCDDSSE